MASGTRVELLAAEFQRAGMAKSAAAMLSSEVVLRHPIVHRVGVQKLTRRLVRHGVAVEEATQLVLTLWGLERLQLGACFQDLLDTLRRAGVDDAKAFPASVEARRLLLQSARAAAPEDDVDVRLARWCVAFLATLLLASGLAQLGAWLG